MPRRLATFFSAFLLALTGLVSALSAPPAERAPDPAPATAAPAAPPPAAHRELAPGVEITIPANRQEDDTHAVHNLVEILAEGANLKWTPKTTPDTRTLADMSTGVDFHRNVWYLEFSFKPVRMIWVDVPQDSGKMQRKLIWYLLYRVKNNGGHLQPRGSADGKYTVAAYNQDVRFFPDFVLQCPEYGNKEYLDRIIPVAVAKIQQKEDPSRKLLNSVEISSTPIPVSTERVDRSVWGVATWQDIDPRVDLFTVNIRGLTNAYRWIDPPGAYKKGAPPGTGRLIGRKTLALNFWRPGDEYLEDQRVIRFGAPGKVDYSWVYR